MGGDWISTMEPVVSTCNCPLIGQSPNQFLFPTLNSTSNMTELPMHPCLSMIVDLDQPHGWSLLWMDCCFGKYTSWSIIDSIQFGGIHWILLESEND